MSIFSEVSQKRTMVIKIEFTPLSLSRLQNVSPLKRVLKRVGGGGKQTGEIKQSQNLIKTKTKPGPEVQPFRWTGSELGQGQGTKPRPTPGARRRKVHLQRRSLSRRGKSQGLDEVGWDKGGQERTSDSEGSGRSGRRINKLIGAERQMCVINMDRFITHKKGWPMLQKRVEWLNFKRCVQCKPPQNFLIYNELLTIEHAGLSRTWNN